MRLDRPVGTLLLLWPTLAALVLAAEGLPSLELIVVFSVGTLLMRSAGCVINDYFDRNLDGHVRRTATRPLATGELSGRQALALFAILLIAAAVLLIFLNPFTQALAFGGVAIAAAYPLMKRLTYLPQVVLGAAFSWGMVMAFSAVQNQLPTHAWLLFMGSVCWIVAYDTLYAMIDREDDLKVGIKSTAILFGPFDRLMVGVLQGLAVLSFFLFGAQAELGWGYSAGVIGMAATFGYQQRLVRARAPDACMHAFKNNTWTGFCLLLGALLELVVLA